MAYSPAPERASKRTYWRGKNSSMILDGYVTAPVRASNLHIVISDIGKILVMPVLCILLYATSA